MEPQLVLVGVKQAVERLIAVDVQPPRDLRGQPFDLPARLAGQASFEPSLRPRETDRL
jgi:hypothetical protein